MSRDQYDIQIREFALGMLRKFHARRFSTQLCIGHQSPEVRTG